MSEKEKPVKGEPYRSIVIPGPCQLYIKEEQTPEQVSDAEADFAEACTEMGNMDHGTAIDYGRFWMFNEKQSRRQIDWLRGRVRELEKQLEEAVSLAAKADDYRHAAEMSESEAADAHALIRKLEREK